MNCAPPWSAGTCHRFGTADLNIYNALYQSGDRSPHSKETPNYLVGLLKGEVHNQRSMIGSDVWADFQPGDLEIIAD